MPIDRNLLSSDVVHKLLMEDFDTLRKEAGWSENVNVRKNKACQLGRSIIRPIKKIIGR